MMGFGMGLGIVGILVMILVWGGLIYAAVWLVKAVFQPGSQTDSSTQSDGDRDARDILDQRYARGELTREQFEGMRQDLEA